jgi:hypothetical protein
MAVEIVGPGTNKAGLLHRLCEALSILPDGVRRLTVEVSIDCVPTVTVERLLDKVDVMLLEEAVEGLQARGKPDPNEIVERVNGKIAYPQKRSI